MTESGGRFSFEKTETGYQASYDGLPDGELEFTLSEDADPKAPRDGRQVTRIAAVVTALAEIYLDQKKRKKKEKE